MRIEQRQELLLDAGVRVIARSGLAGATTRAIAAEANMPLASFHYAFTNHQGYLHALVEREMVPPEITVSASGTFVEALEELMRRLIVDDASGRVGVQLALNGVLHDGLGRELAARLHRDDTHVAHLLEELAQRHDMEWSLDLAPLAEMVNSWRIGALAHAAYVRLDITDNPRNGLAELNTMLARSAHPIAPGATGRAEGLTARQSQIVALISMGMSNEEIAEATSLSFNTVKSYIRAAYRTMGVTSRTQAILWGIDHGFNQDRGRPTPPPAVEAS